VGLGPGPDGGQPRAEEVGDDVIGRTDEDRPIADARVAGDVPDHLGVVVGGQECLVLAAVGHWQPADEISQPCVGSPFLLRVLVQVVVEFPRLVADPQVVRVLAGNVWKTMKLARRISSIFRQAWKQCRSWSAHSFSMWPDSLASSAEAG